MSINDRLYDEGGFLPGGNPPSLGPLKERFLHPPFSVWNAREGFWQDRKRRWILLGIKSELGRGGNDSKSGVAVPGGSPLPSANYSRDKSRGDGRGKVMPFTQRKDSAYLCGPGGLSKFYKNKEDGTGGVSESDVTGTSIFDPVVCELAYRWWCPPGGQVIDPFAGGSVRGIVASVVGLRYWGCELRKEQVESNKVQLNELTTGDYPPEWICGDSLVRMKESPDADFIMSCPPYGNLEVYSDNPCDISNKSYDEFINLYGKIIKRSCNRLKKNRFACFVVTNYRDAQANRLMRNFVGDTIDCFHNAGLEFYNDIVLINAVGSAPVRANNTFVKGSRKVVKSHQNVLVFVKGDPKKAARLLK